MPIRRTPPRAVLWRCRDRAAPAGASRRFSLPWRIIRASRPLCHRSDGGPISATVVSTVLPRSQHGGYVVAESDPSGHLIQGAAQWQVLCELPAEHAEPCAESFPAPRPTGLSGRQQCLTQPLLRVGEPFQAAERRQMERHVAARSPGDSSDRRFVSQEPCLHHSYRHNRNPRSAVPRVSHASLDLGIPRNRSCTIGISMHEQ